MKIHSLHSLQKSCGSMIACFKKKKKKVRKKKVQFDRKCFSIQICLIILYYLYLYIFELDKHNAYVLLKYNVCFLFQTFLKKTRKKPK